MVTVLKGKTIVAMWNFINGYNEFDFFHSNVETTKELIEMLRHLGSDADSEPLNWISTMLDGNSESR
jgi:hypothetical protein